MIRLPTAKTVDELHSNIDQMIDYLMMNDKPFDVGCIGRGIDIDVKSMSYFLVISTWLPHEVACIDTEWNATKEETYRNAEQISSKLYQMGLPTGRLTSRYSISVEVAKKAVSGEPSYKTFACLSQEAAVLAAIKYGGRFVERV